MPRVGSTIPVKPTSYEYTGGSAMTILSPVTGKRYRFDRPGARADVDPRDRSLFGSIPSLKALK